MITYKNRFFSRTSSVTKNANGRYTVEHDAGTFAVIGGAKIGGSSNEWFLEGPSIDGYIPCSSIIDDLELLENF